VLSHSWKQCLSKFILFQTNLKDIRLDKKNSVLGYVSYSRIVQAQLTSAKMHRPSAGLATCKIKNFCVSNKLRHIDGVEIQANLNKLEPRHRMEVRGQLHVPAVVQQEETPVPIKYS
jgi:hypothetical protein